MKGSKVRIAIPIGDPSGIGPEIVLKTVSDLDQESQIDLTIIGHVSALQSQAEACDISFAHINGSTYLVGGYPVNVIDNFDALETPLEFGKVSANYGAACYSYAVTAVELLKANEIDAVTAAPHTEYSVNAAGIEFSGYPSLLEKLTDSVGKVKLLLMGGHLAVMHVTLHQSLVSAIQSITVDAVLQTISNASDFFKMVGRIPKIGVCGINPHAGENGLFGNEDKEIIEPAILTSREKGINLEGPLSPDAIFHRQDLDCIIAMYHDQGHIPVKTIAPRASIAISTGTPYLFGTVAHGSAHDIAGRNSADPSAFQFLLNTLTQLISDTKK